MEIAPKYKVVFQLSSQDSMVHKSLIKQINNLLRALPDVSIEVAVHGQGVDFLRKDSLLKNTIELLQMKQVVFLICENTLRDSLMSTEDVLPSVKTVPSSIAHLIVRQHEGWAYMKAGF